MSKTLAYSSIHKIDWHNADIRAAIEKKAGCKCAEFARRNGIKAYTFYNVFRQHYPKLEKIIADFLGTTPQEIWPSRYLHKCSS
jgi:Ner family transcriptional regulator